MTGPTPTRRHTLEIALGDADPDVRLRAALDVGEGQHAGMAAGLVERFGLERDFQIREALTWAALRVREAALPLVREALRSPRWLARLQAAHTLSKHGDPTDGPRLLPLVSDPVDVVAARAAWAVAQCGDPVVLPALAGQLSRGNAEHRNSLSVALSHFGAAAVPALVGALRHGVAPAVRRHAADTLGLLGSPEADRATDALEAAVDDPDEWVRVAALNALGQLTVPAAWEAIERRTTAPEHRLQVLAGRLSERRPSVRILRRSAATADTRPIPDVEAPPPATAPEGWPAPDLRLVTCEGGPKVAELAPKLALQVAVGRPRYLSRADVPHDVLAEVHRVAVEEALAQGETEATARRIAAGRVEQHLHETVLLEQVSVADPGAVVRDLLFGTEVHVTGFVRLDPATG